jgi:hypothetical protein
MLMRTSTSVGFPIATRPGSAKRYEAFASVLKRPLLYQALSMAAQIFLVSLTAVMSFILLSHKAQSVTSTFWG